MLPKELAEVIETLIVESVPERWSGLYESLPKCSGRRTKRVESLRWCEHGATIGLWLFLKSP